MRIISYETQRSRESPEDAPEAVFAFGGRNFRLWAIARESTGLPGQLKVTRRYYPAEWGRLTPEELRARSDFSEAPESLADAEAIKRNLTDLTEHSLILQRNLPSR